MPSHPPTTINFDDLVSHLNCSEEPVTNPMERTITKLNQEITISPCLKIGYPFTNLPKYLSCTKILISTHLKNTNNHIHQHVPPPDSPICSHFYCSFLTSICSPPSLPINLFGPKKVFPPLLSLLQRYHGPIRDLALISSILSQDNQEDQPSQIVTKGKLLAIFTANT
jgi:hypothetical protein